MANYQSKEIGFTKQTFLDVSANFDGDINTLQLGEPIGELNGKYHSYAAGDTFAGLLSGKIEKDVNPMIIIEYPQGGKYYRVIPLVAVSIGDSLVAGVGGFSKAGDDETGVLVAVESGSVGDVIIARGV